MALVVLVLVFFAGFVAGNRNREQEPNKYIEANERYVNPSSGLYEAVKRK